MSFLDEVQINKKKNNRTGNTNTVERAMIDIAPIFNRQESIGMPVKTKTSFLQKIKNLFGKKEFSVADTIKAQQKGIESSMYNTKTPYFELLKKERIKNVPIPKEIIRGITDVKKGDIPIAGALLDAGDLTNALIVQNKMKKGEDVSPERMNQYRDWFQKQIESKEKSQASAGYRIGRGILESLSFGAELLIASTLTGLSAGASAPVLTAVLAKRGAVKGAREIITKMATDKVAKEVFMNELKAVGLSSVKKGAVILGSQEAIHLPEQTLQRMIGTPVFENQSGTVPVGIIDDGQPLGNAVINGFTSVLSDTASEYSGHILAFLPSQLQKQLIKSSIFKSLIKQNPNISPNAFQKVITRMGWNGIFAELGEERVSDVMKGIFEKLGIGDEPFKLPTKQQLAEEAVSIMLTGGIFKAGAKAYNSVLNKVIETKMDKEVKDKLDELSSIFSDPTVTLEEREQIKGFLRDIGVSEDTITEVMKQEITQEGLDAIASQYLKLKEPIYKREETADILRGTKGMTAEDIQKTYPNIKLTKEVKATDVYGNKVEIPKGEKLTPYELKDGKILLQDGETYLVSKNQFQNIEGNSIVGKPKPFAPELEGVEEVIKGQTNLNNKSYTELIDEYKRTFGDNEYKGLTPEKLKLLLNKKLGSDTTRYSSYQLPGGENYKEILIKAPTKPNITKADGTIVHDQTGQFTSFHFNGDGTNLGGWIRTKEYNWKGKKVAFAEEIQDVTSEASHYDEAVKFIKDKFGSREKFNVLKVKRALIDAVDRNADYFAWINGEQTSARYNLAAKINKTEWKPTEYGRRIVLTPTGDKNTLVIRTDNVGKIIDGNDSIPTNWKGKKLDEVLGKGLADKIMEKESGTLSGEGLKFGGEWANNLYDKQVGNIVKDLTGAKIETLDMGLPIEKGKQIFYSQKTFKELKPSEIKVGLEVSSSERGGTLADNYIITDILGKGKFKAVSKDVVFGLSPNSADYKELVRKWSKTFDISQKTTTQQGIKLTPEIKAKIRGEAPTIKTSGKMFEEKPKLKLETNQETISKEQAVLQLQDFLKRLKLNIPYRFVETILTEDNKKAYGAFFDGTMTFENFITDTTVLHELGHAIFRNLENISLFNGITRKQLYAQGFIKYAEKIKKEMNRFETSFKEKNNREATLKEKAQHKRTITEEYIMEDLETVSKEIENKKKTITGKIGLFLTRTHNAIKKLFGKRDAILDFYNTILEGKATNETTITTDNLIEQYIKGETLDFRELEQQAKQAVFKKEQVTKDAKVLLNERFRNQARGAKAGFKAGYSEARETTINLLTGKYETKIEKIERKQELKDLKENIQQRHIQDIKNAITKYVTESLPQDQRGKFLVSVRDGKTIKDLAKTFVRVDNIVARERKKQAVLELKKTVESLKDSPSVSADYRTKIKDLIDGFDLSKRTQKTLNKLNSLQNFINKELAEGNNIDIPQKILEKLKILSRVSYENMTVEQIETLTNEIELLGIIGKTKWRTKQELYEIEKVARTLELQKTATPINAKEKPAKGIREEKKKWTERYVKLMNGLIKTRASLRPIDGLAEITGMMPMKRTLDLGFGSYLVYNDKRFEDLYEIVKRNNLTQGNIEAVGVYAISKQPTGKEKLILNNGLTEEQIDSLALTTGEQELYDYIINENKKGYPIVRQLSLDLYNQDIGNIENYVSFHSDTQGMSDLEMYDRFGNRPEEALSVLKKNTEHGFIKTRSLIRTTPLDLDIIRVFTRHWDDVAYMDTMARDIRMYQEIVSSPEMREKLGNVGQLAWRKYLDLMARKGGSEGAKRIAVLDIMRRNLAIGVLGFRLSSMFVQFASFGDTMGTIGVEYATKGLTEFSTSREARDFVMDNFPEVRKAVGDDIAYRELGTDMIGKIGGKSMKPLQLFDGIMRSIAVLGAYKKVANESGKAVDYQNPDPVLIQKANELMRQSQGSSYFKDQPLALTTDFGLSGNRSINKTILTFQSFMLNRWDNIERQIWREGFKVENYKQALWKMFLLLAVTAGLEELIRNGVKAIINLLTGSDDEEDKTFISRVVMNDIQSMPIVGSLASALSYAKNPIPILNAINETFEAIPNLVGKGKRDRTRIRAGATLIGSIGSLTGIAGSSQVSQLIKKAVPSEIQDPVKRSLNESVINAKKEIEKIDPKLVERIRKDYFNPIKEAGFGTPEADEIADSMSDGEFEVFKKLQKQYVAEQDLENAENIIKLVEQARDLGFGTPEADALVEELTDSEWRQFKRIQKIIAENPREDIIPQESVEKRNAIKFITDYAKAYGIDPVNAFRAMFTKESLGIVQGNLVELKRFGSNENRVQLERSQEYKKQLLEKLGIPWSKRGDYKLEHIVPVKGGGGSFDVDNLIIVTNDEHDSYTPWDNAVAKAIKEGKIKRKQVEKIAKMLKVDKSISVQEAILMIISNE